MKPTEDSALLTKNMKKIAVFLGVAVIGLMVMNHLTTMSPTVTHQQPQQKPVASKPPAKAKKTEVASVTSTPSGPLVIREQATFKMMPSSTKPPVAIPTESEARAKK